MPAATSRPLKVRFGIEFEFAAADDQRVGEALLKENVPFDYGSSRTVTAHQWSLGHDSSVATGKYYRKRWRGCELRTPCSDAENEQIREQIKAALKACRSAGGEATRTSGMHVHLSSSSRRARIDVEKLSKMVEKAFRKRVMRGRTRYCNPGYSRSCKYYAVRVVRGTHVEVRIFNGTLSSRTALQRLKQVLEMYRECLSRAPEPERPGSQPSFSELLAAADRAMLRPILSQGLNPVVQRS